MATKSNGHKIAHGIEKNLVTNLELVTEQIDDVQHRLESLLVTTDGVLDEDTSIRIAQVRTIMSKIPAYREKCAQVQRRMENCDRRITQLGNKSKVLRTQVQGTSNPYTEEFPLNTLSTQPPAAAADEDGDNVSDNGLLYYRVIYGGGVSVRSQPSFESPRNKDHILPYNHVFQAIVRYSPNGSDMFVKLADSSGWVFESKGDTSILERVLDPSLFIDPIELTDDDVIAGEGRTSS